MKNSFKILLSLALTLSALGTINSCGKVLGNEDDSSTNDNQCEHRYVSGYACIVCSKGGVSCRW